jgi:hypothetical protein
VQQINNDTAIPKKENQLIVPSVQILWTPESVWDTGIVSAYNNSLYALAVERFVESFSLAFYAAHFSLDIRPTIVQLYTPILDQRKFLRQSSATFWATP